MTANDVKQDAITQNTAQSSESSPTMEPAKIQQGVSKRHSNGFLKSSSEDEHSQLVNERTKLLDSRVKSYNATDAVSEPIEDEERAHHLDGDSEVDSKEDNSLPPGTLTIISLLLVGSFVASADSTMVMATYGTIASSFNAFTGAAWINTGFMVTLTSVQPLLGKVSDIVGRKSVLLWCYALFAVGNLGIGLSQTLWQVIAGRVVTGLGGGGMVVTVMIVIIDLVPLRQVALVRSYVAVVQTLGRVFGAPIGGYLADSIGWRWSFIGQFPLLALAAFLVAFKLPSTGPSSTSTSKLSRLRRIDFVGAVLLFTTIVLFLSAFALGGQALPWGDYRVILLLVGSLVLGAVFTMYELKVAIEPIFPPQLVARRDVLVSNMLSIFMNFSQLSMMLTVPIYFQVTQHASNAAAASRLVPLSIAGVLGSLPAGYLIRRTGKYKNLAIIGAIISVLGYVLMILYWNGHTNWFEALYPVSTGFGASFVFQSNFIALTAAVAKEEVAMATGSLFLSMGIGLITGISITASIQQGSLRTLLQRKLTGTHDQKIIESVISDLKNIWTYQDPTRQIIVDAYVKSLEYSHICSLASALIALGMTFFIREMKMRQ